MGKVLVGVSQELSGLKLGDARLERRAVQIVDALASAPDDSFPSQTSDDGELEALYRFLNNDRVDLESLLAAHVCATAARASEAGDVLVVHDTTGFSFGGETKRRGLGRIKKSGQGFNAHVGLVVRAADGVPLGVVGIVPVIRTAASLPRSETRSKVYDRPREFERWETLLTQSISRLGHCTAIHVMDREADAYPLFCKLAATKQCFVIRSRNDRVLEVPAGDRDKPRYLYEALDGASHVMTREVRLSTKRPDKMARLRKAPGRMTRTATLRVAVANVEVRHPPYTAGKSRHGSHLPRAVPMSVVHVYEVGVPKNQKPVEWVLYTNLPVATPEQVGRVIDAYRRRWLIEEYFKALKTGCAYETRQLESKHALLNALGLFVPIAWRLLTLRHLAREEPDGRAEAVLNARQLTILRSRNKVKLSRHATLREGMLAIAAEGGHIKNNGDPGWLVLARGYEKLLYMELGFALSEASKK